jgi:hypothetical protein
MRNIQHTSRKRAGGAILSAEQHVVLAFLDRSEHKVWSAEAIARETGLRTGKVIDAIGQLRRRAVRRDSEDASPLADIGPNGQKLDYRSAYLKAPPTRLQPMLPDERDEEIAKLRAQLADAQKAKGEPKKDSPPPTKAP